MAKEEIEKRWTKYGKDNLVGKTIKQVRYLTQAEADIMGWYSRDDEGNDGGALFGNDKDGKELIFPVIR
jgi:hypothetical protein